MLTNNQLQQIMKDSGYSSVALNQQPVLASDQQSEKGMIATLSELLQRDGAAMNFVAAGAYEFYRPAVLDSINSDGTVISSQGEVHSVTGLQKIKKNLESKLAGLTGMEHAVILGEGLTQALCDLIFELSQAASHSATKNHSVLLPATLPPALRLALRTGLKYLSIETVVVNFDAASGQVSRTQLEALNIDGVVAVLLPYVNFFGAIEDVAEISDWAHQNQIKTIVIADPLFLTYLKSPAQITGSVDFLFADLQSLGLPLNKKGISVTLRAAITDDFDLKTNSVSALESIQLELLTMQMFIRSQTAEQLQQSVTQSHKNLMQMVEQLLEIPGMSLKFNSPVINECVLQLDGIDLKRALQILIGHNILAGYFLEDEYPELMNCVLLHCNDQHDESQIGRFVQKMATVVKNLSTAACPVKPKFS